MGDDFANAAARCLNQAAGNGFRSRSSDSPAGSRPFRIASTMSGASSVSPYKAGGFTLAHIIPTEMPFVCMIEGVPT
jgi:uncharacterized membrane protein